MKQAEEEKGKYDLLQKRFIYRTRYTPISFRYVR